LSLPTKPNLWKFFSSWVSIAVGVYHRSLRLLLPVAYRHYQFKVTLKINARFVGFFVFVL
jgi:hypothetical protein